VSDQIERLLRGLGQEGEAAEIWRLSERRLAEGDAGFLVELGLAVANRYGRATWQFRSVLPPLVRLLATAPGADHLEPTCRLVNSVADAGITRYAAALLATHHPADELAAVLLDGGAAQDGPTADLNACLAHELLLAGAAVEKTSWVCGWAGSPHRAAHPLGWLPLSLTTLEKAGTAAAQPHDLPGPGHRALSGPTLARPATGPAVAAETTTESTATAIGAAVLNWVEDSNGRFEARTYLLADDLDIAPGTVVGLLFGLGLECLSGLDDRDRLVLAERSPADIWRRLFTAAATGGAYRSGERGAFGRLAAWRSVAALAGAPPDASPAQVERLVDTCAWYTFDADADWFDRVAWDLAIVAVGADRRGLAVLAATDSD
jgi:hypothetical protein